MLVHKRIYNLMNQVIVPGSLFLRRERLVLLRRWRRAMLLPETVLLCGLIVISAAMTDTAHFYPRQRAMAASSIENLQSDKSVPDQNAQAIHPKHAQRVLQDRVYTRPGHLMTLTDADVITVFSYADLHRQEGPMTLLQFRGYNCVLDVFFSHSGGTAKHYEFRRRAIATSDPNHGDHNVRPRECIKDILRSRLNHA